MSPTLESKNMGEYVWTRVTEQAAFAARDGAGALVFQDKMWLLGGWNPHNKEYFPHVCNSEVWTSTDGAHWKLCAYADWEGRHTAGYAVHNDRMWVVGGDPIQGHYQDDVWSSPDGVSWEQATKQVPWGPRVLHHTVAFNNKLWVMGGQTLPPFAPQEEHFYKDVWCSEDGAKWECAVDHAPWSARGMIGGSVVFNNRMWLLGGGTYETPKRPKRDFFNEVWSSANGVQWEQHPNAPWEPRQYHDVAVWDNKMWVLEGYCKGPGNSKDVWYSANGIDWQEVPDTPWAPRHAASVFVYRDALWVVAGNNMQPDAWKLQRAPRKLDDIHSS